MIKYILTFLLIVPLTLYSQKEDRNWVFGYNAGIDFSDSTSPQTFKPKSVCFEVAASISDSVGNLILFVSRNIQTQNIEIRNYNSDIIDGGESINSHSTFARGILIIPVEGSIYYIVHVGNVDPNCPHIMCPSLFYTIVDVSANNSKGKVISKDNLIISEEINEGIAAIRHSNGKDWWVLAHQRPMPHCTKKYYKVLLSNSGVQNIFEQDIGSSICSSNFPNVDYYSGDIAVSRSGKKIAYVRSFQNLVDVLSFNRCTGILYNHRLLDNNFIHDLYTGCFSQSEDMLYVSYGALSGSSIAPSGLLQYDLRSGNRYTLWTNDTISTINYSTGQLQLAPDNKIYMSYCEKSSSINSNQYNQNLSVINEPDSLGVACNFQPFNFYLGDSSFTSFALPNMPNYNLGPLSIYKADAGKNHIICLNQQEKGAYLGDSAIAGVEYQWYPTLGMDSPNIAQPYVIPDSSLWYYVTITDTSIKNACQSRTDSVWVEYTGLPNAAFTYSIDEDSVFFESNWESKVSEYEWYFGDGQSAEGKTTQHKYAYSADSITVMHIVSSRCGADTAYAKFLIEAPVDTSDTLGVQIPSFQSIIKVYPNPTKNTLYIESNAKNQHVENIQIIDLNGRSVIQTKNSPVQTNELSQGIYFYQVELKNGRYARGKFVKE